MSSTIRVTPASCPDCRTRLGPGLLECPVCRRLVHGDALASLARRATEADAAGDVSGALTLWREALDLLPPGSRQHATVTQKVNDLSARAPIIPSRPGAGGGAGTAGGKHDKSKAGGVAAAVAAAALLLWKFKFLLAFVLTKGKLLLLGLTKSGTFLSMFLSF